MASNNQEEGMGEGRRWSECLLPAVDGASSRGKGATCRKNDQDPSDENSNADHSDYFEEEGEEGRGGGGDSGRIFFSMSSLHSNLSFKSLPSYMKAKSGVEMDPDRFRRRKQMILDLPEGESAKECLQAIATNWDPIKNGQLLGFDAVSLDPTQFKELFRRNFGVLLSAADLGTLVSIYDKRGDGRADSLEFIKDFWQMGRDGRVSQARRRAEVARQMKARQTQEHNERVERLSRLKEVALGQHTEQDVETAMEKMKEIAARYDVARDNSFHQLEQGGVMGPTTFREQLRTIFGVRLTRAELAGLVSAFNLHRDGMIDAKEFAFRFHCLGRESRAARVADGAARDERARRRKREQEHALVTKMIGQSQCRVNWEYSDQERERGLAAIARAACFYDRDRLGADVDRIAQMKMNPTAFRAQMLQNFRVHLGPGELGAVFDEFDSDKSGHIDGTELMKTFFRMGRGERAKRLAEAERQQHRRERKAANVRRKIEDRFIEQTVAKVVWPALPHDPFHDDFGVSNNDDSITSRGTSIADSSMGQTSVGSPSAGRGVTRGERRGRPSRRRLRESAGGGEGSCRSMVRGRPKISISTAEFLGKIEKEELTIRAMTALRAGRIGLERETVGGGGGGTNDECRHGTSANFPPSSNYCGGRPAPIAPSAYRSMARHITAAEKPSGKRRHNRRRRRRSSQRSVLASGETLNCGWSLAGDVDRDDNNSSSCGHVGNGSGRYGRDCESSARLGTRLDSGDGGGDGDGDGGGGDGCSGGIGDPGLLPGGVDGYVLLQGGTSGAAGTGSMRNIPITAGTGTQANVMSPSPWGGTGRRGSTASSNGSRIFESREGERRNSSSSHRDSLLATSLSEEHAL